MAGLSDSFENQVLDHLFGKAVLTAPNMFVGVSSTTPNDDGTNITEPSGGAYARVAVLPTDFNVASGGLIDNLNDIIFPKATADWLLGVNLTHVVIFDSLTLGNMICFGSITTPTPVLQAQTLKFLAGDLDTTLD